MNWQEIISIIAAVFGIVTYFYNRIEKKADDRHTALKLDISELKGDVKDLRKDIQLLDSRVSRIEGQLNRPPYWEPELHKKEK